MLHLAFVIPTPSLEHCCGEMPLLPDALLEIQESKSLSGTLVSLRLVVWELLCCLSVVGDRFRRRCGLNSFRLEIALPRRCWCLISHALPLCHWLGFPSGFSPWWRLPGRLSTARVPPRPLALACRSRGRDAVRRSCDRSQCASSAYVYSVFLVRIDCSNMYQVPG